jgi:hypothetical protein
VDVSLDGYDSGQPRLEHYSYDETQSFRRPTQPPGSTGICSYKRLSIGRDQRAFNKYVPSSGAFTAPNYIGTIWHTKLKFNKTYLPIT